MHSVHLDIIILHDELAGAQEPNQHVMILIISNHSYVIQKKKIHHCKVFSPGFIWCVYVCPICCNTTSHNPQSKTCTPPPANGICNTLKLSPPCGYFYRRRPTFAIWNAVFVYPPSSQRGGNASLVSAVLHPLGFAHYRLALQKQLQTLVQGQRQPSFVRDPSEGGHANNFKGGLVYFEVPYLLFYANLTQEIRNLSWIQFYVSQSLNLVTLIQFSVR